MRLIALILAVALLAGPVRAEPPGVAVDIRPVHSLVAAVMEGVAQPVLLSDAQASPHAAALRPSAARALQGADLLVWVGPALTPWLARAADALAPAAQRLTLLEHPATETLPARPSRAFGEAHDHGHDHRHDHARDGIGPDPHVWLDPRNAAAWVAPIADALAAADPVNAETYAANAATLTARLEALDASLGTDLAPVADAPFAVVHDAFQYLEHRYGLTAAGALSPSDASAPGPASLRSLRATIEATGARCVFVEPLTQDDLTSALSDGLGVDVAVLDPLGLSLEPGPGLYSALMENMAAGMVACLS